MTESPVVIHGDCLTELRNMPDSSIDAIVTDPPYGLSQTCPDKVADTITKWASGEREYVPGGKGFMGKAWDGFVPPPAVWDECLRVLKPGGHMLVFAGSRTQDLMGLSVRLAGFEIRDSVAWLYGSGFPKSMDVGKAIDKRAEGDMRRAKLAHFIAERGVDARWLQSHGVADSKSFSDWTVEGHAPSNRNWALIRDALEVTPEEEAEFEREIVGAGTSGKTYGMGGLRGVETSTGEYDITAPATPEAERWAGWGTALKPAHEPVIMARKPLEGTVAGNVLEHGAGGLNIDGCRVASADPLVRPDVKRDDNAVPGKGLGAGVQVGLVGRWPANVVVDEYAANVVDQQGGGVSRYFYTAKAPKAERPNVGGVQHPTVKPLTLMRWLVRMVTPPGGAVLDPFAGSGATLEAAKVEGFAPVGIEAEADYIPLIEARLSRVEDILETIA